MKFSLQDIDSSLVKLSNGKIVTANVAFNAQGIPSPAATDAFGNSAVSQFTPKAAWAFPYNISTLNYRRSTLNGGSITHDASMAVLSTGTNVAGSAELTTRLTMRYFPGVGGLVRFTTIFSPGVPDSRQLQGYGNSTDGLFLGFLGETFGILRINHGVENFIPIGSWDDPYGVVADLDPTKLNVFQIQFQWLGGGEIRYFIEKPEYGLPVIIHREEYAGKHIETSLRNPSLPLRAYVANEGNATDLVLKTPSASVGLEGGAQSRALRALGGVDNTVTTAADVLTPICSVRAPETYEGLENRLSVYFDIITVALTSTNNAIGNFRVIVDGTLTGASFVAAVPGGSPVEVDTAATAITGGQYIRGLTIAGQGNGSLPEISDARIVPGEIFTIAVETSKIADVAASITYDAEV